MSKHKIPGLDQALQKDIYAHCFGVTDREVGGVLVGVIERGKPPRVDGSIRAVQADETAAQLTFTQDTWEHIHRALERDHPDRQIVGWYHTHPGYGLFLSDQDMFIHRNFFQNRSQIALVIDPLANEEGIFAWISGEVTEYIRRETAYRGSSMPPPQARRPAGPDATRMETREGTSSAQLPVRFERSGAALPRLERSIAEVPLTTWIYLAVIGISVGTVFWELILK